MPAPPKGSIPVMGDEGWENQPLPSATVTGPLEISNFPVVQPVSGPLTDAQLRAAAVPVSGTFALKTDAGRTSVALIAEAVAGLTLETLVTLNQSRGGAATTTVTSYQVPSGKAFRLQALILAWTATTTTANTCRVRLRVNATGLALVTSPVQMSFRLGWETQAFVANESKQVVVPLDDGFELPAGAGLAVTHQEAAANGTLDVSLIGFEYSP